MTYKYKKPEISHSKEDKSNQRNDEKNAVSLNRRRKKKKMSLNRKNFTLKTNTLFVQKTKKMH